MKKIITTLTIIVCLFSTMSPVGAKEKIKPKGKNPFGLFGNVDNCQPTLSWKTKQEGIASYDLKVFEAIAGNRGSPTPGKEIVFQEGIQETQFKLNQTLSSDTKYLWTIRPHYQDGQVGEWVTYNKSSGIPFLASETHHNILFGFKTPQCDGEKDSDSDSNEQENASSQKIYKTPRVTIPEITSLLQKNHGAFLLRNRIVFIKKEQAPLKTLDVNELVKEGAKIIYKKTFSSIGVIAPNSKKIIYLRPNKEGLFAFVGQSGEYKIVQFIAYDGSSEYTFPVNISVNLESKKAKYIGDVNVYFQKAFGLNRGFQKQALSKDEADFKTWLKTNAPSLVSFLSTGEDETNLANN